MSTVDIQMMKNRWQDRQLRYFLDRLGRNLSALDPEADLSVDGAKLSDNNSYTLRRLLDGFNLALGIPVATALMRNRLRWVRWPLWTAILLAELILNLTWMWPDGSWWLKTGGIGGGLIIWVLGLIGTERRYTQFGIGLCQHQADSLGAWPKRTRIRVLRRYADTLPASVLAPSKMRPDILEALQVQDQTVISTAESMATEYYDGAKNLIFTVKALLA